MSIQSFDNQVKRKANAHEAPVPPGVWEAIVKEKKKRRLPVFWWITGSAILLLATGIGILYKITVNHNATGNQLTATIQKPDPSRLPRPFFLQSKAASPVGISNYTNKSLPVKKDMPVKDSPSSLRKNTLTSLTIDDSSFIPENAGKDAIVTVNEDMLNIRVENTGNMLLKDSAIAKPSILLDTSIARPTTPTIKKIRRNQSGWSIDISVIPYQPFQQNQSLLFLNRTIIDNLHTSEYKPNQVRAKLSPALAFNLSLSKRINTHMEIGAGLQYAVIKEHITLTGKETNIFYQVVERLDNSGSSPVLRIDTVATVTTGTRVIDAINSYRLLEIPLLIQYTLVEQPSWSLRLNGGLQLGIAARYHNSIDNKLIPDYTSGAHPGGSKEMQIGFFSGVRFTKRLTKKYQVFAAPYLRYSTGNYDTKTIINNKPIHQVGIAFGISYKIGGAK